MNTRNLVAFVTNKIIGNYQQPVFKEIVNAAAVRDLDLMVFEGRLYKSSIPNERESNLVYEFINPSHIDMAVISAGTVFNESEDSAINDFLKRHENVPMVLLNKGKAGYPSVTVDNAAGIRELCRHLYDVRNVRRFTFVSGPEDNADSRGRRDAT